jgi:hypothetical protein
MRRVRHTVPIASRSTSLMLRTPTPRYQLSTYTPPHVLCRFLNDLVRAPPALQGRWWAGRGRRPRDLVQRLRAPLTMQTAHEFQR